jgi:hypothetical protein
MIVHVTELINCHMIWRNILPTSGGFKYRGWVAPKGEIHVSAFSYPLFL